MKKMTLRFRATADGQKIARHDGRDIHIQDIRFDPKAGESYECEVWAVEVGMGQIMVCAPSQPTIQALSAACDPAWNTGTVVANLCPQRHDRFGLYATHPLTGRLVRFAPGSNCWVGVLQTYQLEQVTSPAGDEYIEAYPEIEPARELARKEADPNQPDASWVFQVPLDRDAITVTFRKHRSGSGVFALHRLFDRKMIVPAWGKTVVIGQPTRVIVTQVLPNKVVVRSFEPTSELRQKHGVDALYTAQRPTEQRQLRPAQSPSAQPQVAQTATKKPEWSNRPRTMAEQLQGLKADGDDE
ncbi:MAG: hypothetical protein V1738_05510 [Patescibacteria group bacterium]